MAALETMDAIARALIAIVVASWLNLKAGSMYLSQQLCTEPCSSSESYPDYWRVTIGTCDIAFAKEGKLYSF